MTDKKQPEALRLAGLLELAPENGVEPQTTEDSSAELRRLHAENETLHVERERNLNSIRVCNEIINKKNAELESLTTGYAAARLEIESLQARIKTMAEEHADELMVAHMDGIMRAALAAAPAQPAPQQEAQEPVAWYVTGCGRLLDEDEAKAEARRIGGTARAMPLYTAPQADSVLEDAARESEYRRGYRHGYEQRDAEVRGALV